MVITNEDLCHGIVVIGSEQCAIPDVSGEVITRLRELGLAHWKVGEHASTPTGRNLLVRLQEDGGIVELV